MSTPLELVEEERRARQAALVIAMREREDAVAAVEAACEDLIRAQTALIVELKKPTVRSHRKKEVIK